MMRRRVEISLGAFTGFIRVEQDTEFTGSGQVPHLSIGTQHHYDGRPSPQLTNEILMLRGLKPVHDGHAAIKNDHLVAGSGEHFQRLGPNRRLTDLNAHVLQHAPQHQAVGRIIIHHEMRWNCRVEEFTFELFGFLTGFKQLYDKGKLRTTGPPNSSQRASRPLPQPNVS